MAAVTGRHEAHLEASTAPRRARSALRGKPAIGEAVDDAQRAIDSALGDADPLDE
jgi:hypothetical protein